MKVTRMLRSIHQRLPLIVIACVSAAIAASATQADSLWERHNPRRAFLFEDSRARRIGDLVTIMINESTSVDNSEAKDMSKSTAADGALSVDSTTGGDFGTSSANLAFDAGGSSNRSFSGEATYQNSREFQDRITARVIDIDPAGNLIVHGTRGTHVSGEHRVLSISGTIRPIDINADNTISSRFVTDMHLIYDGEGAEPRFTRQGWLGRFVNKIWPF